MNRRRFFWQLYPSFIAIVVIALAAILTANTVALRKFQLQQTERELSALVALATEPVRLALSAPDSGNLEALCRRFESLTATRYTVILPGGRVVGDSDRDPDSMENHAGRPEIAAVLSGADQGSAVRSSRTLNRDLVYVAAPIRSGDSLVAVLRASKASVSMLAPLNSALGGVTAVAAGIFVVVSLVALVLSRRVSKPVEELTRGAECFARGELRKPLAIPPSHELGRLAEAMNAMAVELGNRIDAITQQRNEQEGILACMVEGVVAVNVEERLILINRGAALMLGIDAQSARGRLVQEAIRNSDIQTLARKTLSLSSNGIVEGEVTLLSDPELGERTLQVHGTVLRDGRDKTIGAMIVLNDVSRLKRLESIRRDFVANVSHELRTPLTSIQGFVETLLAGAHEDFEDRKKFLEIIATQTGRLNALIEDLLTLSRIENEAEKEGLNLEPAALAPVIKEAVDVCSMKAREKSITVEISCDPVVRAHINPFLFQQALINLVDNAVKYSEPGKSVRISAAATGSEVTVSVHDQGPGIEPAHLSRIFERFYRVDKARSRKLGGTGLGLAIVKHIMQSHRGSVTVESVVGSGSVFTLHVPV